MNVIATTIHEFQLLAPIELPRVGRCFKLTVYARGTNWATSRLAYLDEPWYKIYDDLVGELMSHLERLNKIAELLGSDGTLKADHKLIYIKGPKPTAISMTREKLTELHGLCCTYDDSANLWVVPV